MEGTVEINLREMCSVLLKRIWIILLCAAILGAATLVYTTNFVTPLYDASVTIYVNNNTTRTDGTYISSSDLAVALKLVATYVNIIQSDRVLDKVIADVGLTLTSEQVRPMISAEPVGDTEMFAVTVKSPNPQLSADLANSIAKIAPGEISEIIEGSSAKIIDQARVPVKRSSPNYTTNTILGALIGAVLAAAVVLIQNMLDTRVRNEEQLANICAAPILGLIPDMTKDQKTAAKKVRW